MVEFKLHRMGLWHKTASRLDMLSKVQACSHVVLAILCDTSVRLSLEQGTQPWMRAEKPGTGCGERDEEYARGGHATGEAHVGDASDDVLAVTIINVNRLESNCST